MNPTPASSPTALPEPQSSDQVVRALVGEYLEQKKIEEEEASRVDSTRRLRRVLTIVALVTCAIVWILPSFYHPPEEPVSPERVDASARTTLFLAAERVRSFQRSHGRLPLVLAEARVDSTGIEYWRSTTTQFEMWIMLGAKRLTYRSSMSGPEFLGASLNILATSR